MDSLDGYVMRARLFPALLAIAPALVFLLVSVGGSYDELGLPEVLMSATVGVLFFAFADIARRFGRHAERRIFASTGGRPFPTALRHRHGALSSYTKLRYHTYLGELLGRPAPTEADEAETPDIADQFYVLCGDVLRERTRDQARFHLLFSENVSYGFRRNLYGLKYPGLFLNILTAAASLWLIWQEPTENLVRYGPVLIIGFIHVVYFVLGVTLRSVFDAGELYGRQLVLSCESLMQASESESPR